MAKYPVELNDQTGLVDNLNYLLSGNQSLGQSVQGQVFSTQAYQTGNNVLPFTSALAVLGRTETIATVDWLDDNTIKFTYPTALSTPAYSLGQSITATGTTITEYNKVYTSVVQTTTTFVVVKSQTAIPNLGSGTGGTLTYDAGVTSTFKYLHTDCLGVANISGGTDRAVISAQIDNNFQYAAINPSSLTYTVAINRYKLFDDSSFTFDATVAYQVYTATIPTTTNAATLLTITSGSKPVTTYPYTYPLTLAASGAGLVVTIEINASAAGVYDTTNTTITIINGGYGWLIGDTITIPGTDLGGATPADDLVLTVSDIGSNTPGNDFLRYATIFTAVKDTPQPGSYVYFLDTSYYDASGETFILGASFNYRSLTAQVIKE